MMGDVGAAVAPEHPAWPAALQSLALYAQALHGQTVALGWPATSGCGRGSGRPSWAAAALAATREAPKRPFTMQAGPGTMATETMLVLEADLRRLAPRACAEAARLQLLRQALVLQPGGAAETLIQWWRDPIWCEPDAPPRRLWRMVFLLAEEARLGQMVARHYPGVLATWQAQERCAERLALGGAMPAGPGTNPDVRRRGLGFTAGRLRAWRTLCLAGPSSSDAHPKALRQALARALSLADAVPGMATGRGWGVAALGHAAIGATISAEVAWALAAWMVAGRGRALRSLLPNAGSLVARQTLAELAEHDTAGAAAEPRIGADLEDAGSGTLPVDGVSAAGDDAGVDEAASLASSADAMTADGMLDLPAHPKKGRAVAAGSLAAGASLDADPAGSDAADADAVEDDPLTDLAADVRDGARQRLPVLRAHDTAPGTWQDEWDFRRQRYRHGWVRIEHCRPVPRDLGWLQSVRADHGPLAQRLTRAWMRVPPVRRSRQHRQTDGDALDLNAAIASRLDRLAGGAFDDAVYTAHRSPRRELCVAWLLDVSASTGYFVTPAPEPAATAGSAAPGPSDGGWAYDDDDPLWMVDASLRHLPPPAGRRVIDLAKEAIALACDGLHRLGDRFGVFAFSGQGRLSVRLHTAKGFDEPWSATAAARLAALEPQGATRTGAAVRDVSAALRAVRAEHKLLIVLSDGYPQDSDYGEAPSDLPYALHDTAQALREAERAGILPFCLAIDAAAHDYMRSLCPPSRYRVIADAHTLADCLGDVCAGLRAQVRQART